MKTINKIFFAFALLVGLQVQAQVGIGTSTLEPSALLTISANGSAVGLVMSSIALRDVYIISPSTGLVIYNTVTNALEVTVSSGYWVNLVNGTVSAVIVAGSPLTGFGALGIGTTSPDPYALLDVTSTTKGVLLPMASTDPTGVAGMIYYNTTSDIVKLYNGTSWISLIN